MFQKCFWLLFGATIVSSSVINRVIAKSILPARERHDIVIKEELPFQKTETVHMSLSSPVQLSPPKQLPPFISNFVQNGLNLYFKPNFYSTHAPPPLAAPLVFETLSVEDKKPCDEQKIILPSVPMTPPEIIETIPVVEVQNTEPLIIPQPPELPQVIEEVFSIQPIPEAPELPPYIPVELPVFVPVQEEIKEVPCAHDEVIIPPVVEQPSMPQIIEEVISVQPISIPEAPEIPAYNPIELPAFAPIQEEIIETPCVHVDEVILPPIPQPPMIIPVLEEQNFVPPLVIPTPPELPPVVLPQLPLDIEVEKIPEPCEPSLDTIEVNQGFPIIADYVPAVPAIPLIPNIPHFEEEIIIHQQPELPHFLPNEIPSVVAVEEKVPCPEDQKHPPILFYPQEIPYIAPKPFFMPPPPLPSVFLPEPPISIQVPEIMIPNYQNVDVSSFVPAAPMLPDFYTSECVQDILQQRVLPNIIYKK